MEFHNETVAYTGFPGSLRHNHYFAKASQHCVVGSPSTPRGSSYNKPLTTLNKAAGCNCIDEVEVEKHTFFATVITTDRP